MKIRIGYEIAYDSTQETAMILTLSVHSSRVSDIVTPQPIAFDPPIASRDYIDRFGNICTRVVAPAGRLMISNEQIIADSGLPDPVALEVEQHPVDDLPDDVLLFLLGSRYCETDRLSETAWALFGDTPPGWARVQAICDYVHDHVTFGYEHARPTMTARDVYREKHGVCRDFTHLAVTFCRCMNIPARYCTGYLGDIGVPPSDIPMDFSAWFEAYLGGQWYTFDARHNQPRIGRILIARGRDATDTAISTSHGPSTLASFKVVTEELR
jgi:transglutaminase-like putative cysteine protease